MSATILQGDCREVMRGLEADSVDAIVTDPPYHLTSIVQRFGSKTAVPAKSNGATGVYIRASRGFMGQTWDGGDVAFDPDTWRAALRVLKPGGHLLAFGGSRTYHRMVCAIEDAGFEVRDQIMWVYGSGFPKSHNIGNGRGTALKPAHEPIVLARKPLVGTVASNVVQFGTGALNVDACRVPGDVPSVPQPAFNSPTGKIYGFKAGEGRNGEMSSAPAGRWPANLIHDGSDEVEAAFAAQSVAMGMHSAGKARAAIRKADKPGMFGLAGGDGHRFCDDGPITASRFFYCAKASKRDRDDGLSELSAKRAGTGALRDNERPRAPRANHHSTVKPTELMRYLCRLVTPSGGTVFDPFAGTGSTGRGAILEGFNFIGAELSPEYADIARRRIEAAMKHNLDAAADPDQLALWSEEANHD